MVTFNKFRSALAKYSVVLRPDKSEPGWWAGAPSVCKGEGDAFFLAYFFYKEIVYKLFLLDRKNRFDIPYSDHAIIRPGDDDGIFLQW